MLRALMVGGVVATAVAAVVVVGGRGAAAHRSAPDAETLAFEGLRTTPREHGAIYSIHADGSGRRQLVVGGEGGFAWSPDGRRIAFSADRGLYVAGRDGTGVRLLTRKPLGSPTWSPGGTQIAVEEQYSIFVIGAGGKDSRALTHPPPNAFDAGPDWSPDGRWIVFERRNREMMEPGPHDDLTSTVLAIRPNGTGLHRIATLNTGTSPGACPDWSPDGSKIAYAVYTGRDADGFMTTDIFVMNADGGGRTRLTRTTVDEYWPDWSPDGTRIAFSRYRSGNLEIYVMNANGTHARRVTRDAWDSQFPQWQPPR